MTRVDPNNSTIFNNTLRNDVSSREINAKFRNDMITMESAGKHGTRQWEWCGGVSGVVGNKTGHDPADEQTKQGPRIEPKRTVDFGSPPTAQPPNTHTNHPANQFWVSTHSTTTKHPQQPCPQTTPPTTQHTTTTCHVHESSNVRNNAKK